MQLSLMSVATLYTNTSINMANNFTDDTTSPISHRTTVRDDRSYTSGWEHQRLADANGRSDFVHKYMDL